MTLTDQQIRAMMPRAPALRLTPHLPYIPEALAFGEINTALRTTTFMAQIAHESGEYRYMEEIADGSDYEGRVDLGNTEPGDGVRYKGRAPLQITGRAAYRACGLAMGLDLLAHPELLTLPQHGTKASAWFWRSYKPWLNPASDRGWFRAVTRLVNGGYNGWSERLQYYQRNRHLLELEPYSEDDEDRSIRQFQASRGLLVDGDVGPHTLAALLA